MAQDADEPYRKIIADLEDRLEGTIDWCYSKLNQTPRRTTKVPIFDNKELIEPLLKMHKSLVYSGFLEFYFKITCKQTIIL